MPKATMMLAVVAVGVCLAGGLAWAQDKPAAQEKPAAPAAQEKDKAAAADPISGEWEGAVEMPDGAMPFNLKLKLDKDKLTGEIGSQQGAVPLTDGSFADGKLAVSFTYVDGNAVAMAGTLTDGQLTGSLNYGGGQMVANWSARKKAQK